MTDSFTISPHSKEFGPSPRWVRVYFNRQLIADSKEMMLLRESDHLPLYYFPKEDVRMDCLSLVQSRSSNTAPAIAPAAQTLMSPNRLSRRAIS